MEKRTFLIVLFFVLLFFLGSINSEVKGAFDPGNGGGGSCVGRGAFCLGSDDCCAGVCFNDSCSCSSNCCSLLSELDGGRGDDCYCQDECRPGATCTGGICCDERTELDADVDCYCDTECKSGQCIGGVCFDPAASVCSSRGGECDGTSDCCTGLVCRAVLHGTFPGFDNMCCDPNLNLPDGERCYCRDECINNNCIRYICGGPPPVPFCGDGNLDSGEECEVGHDCSGGEICSNCSCVSGDEDEDEDKDNGWLLGGNGGIIDLQSPLGCTTTDACIGSLINFLFSLAVILTPLMIIMAGFLYITAAGKPEKIVQAQKLITWTLIGFLIASLARAIIYVITSVIGG